MGGLFGSLLPGFSQHVLAPVAKEVSSVSRINIIARSSASYENSFSYQ